ncbi:hypothetical protein BD779DRAFT_1786687 [Infundibulicybe gibba]|nr:hypothetical protein BD779DRAFT_1786687 [Infundibulicybe gibba]
MVAVNALAIFGPSPESYMVSCGRCFSYRNIPQSLADTIQNGGLSMMSTAWISVTRNMQDWVGLNDATGERHYSDNIAPEILKQLANAEHVSFGDANEYIVNLESVGAWYGNIDNPAVLESLASLRKQVPDFDARLEGIIIGHGKNHFYALTHGFVFHLDDELERDPRHPLTKVVREFQSAGSWRILKSSTLCPWDPRYFFLNFQEEGSTVIQRRWNLPPEMEQKMQELRDLVETPEEQRALLAHEQMQMAYLEQIQMAAISQANAVMEGMDAMQSAIW